jgi:transglutaminase-like putative cysteine protease
MIHYRVVHTTRYHYDTPVLSSHNEAHLTPRFTPRQRCRTHELLMQPGPSAYHQRQDFFGNLVTYFAIEETHTTLEVSAISEVELTPATLVNVWASLPWEVARERLRTDFDEETIAARHFTLDSPSSSAGSQLASYAARFLTAGRPLLEATLELMQHIHQEFNYDPHFTTVATPLHDVLLHRRGVCQDFAHLAIGCLRAWGLAARYVSGYVDAGSAPDQFQPVGAAASHAWFAVYSPGQGWVDFDPTNNLMPGDGHITVAWGRDYGDVTPLKGVLFGGGSHTLDVAVEVYKR